MRYRRPNRTVISLLLILRTPLLLKFLYFVSNFLEYVKFTKIVDMKGVIGLSARIYLRKVNYCIMRWTGCCAPDVCIVRNDVFVVAALCEPVKTLAPTFTFVFPLG